MGLGGGGVGVGSDGSSETEQGVEKVSSITSQLAPGSECLVLGAGVGRSRYSLARRLDNPVLWGGLSREQHFPGNLRRRYDKFLGNRERDRTSTARLSRP